MSGFVASNLEKHPPFMCLVGPLHLATALEASCCIVAAHRTCSVNFSFFGGAARARSSRERTQVGTSEQNIQLAFFPRLTRLVCSSSTARPLR